MINVEAMQRLIMDIKDRLLSDRLKLNDDKTEFIVIGTRDSSMLYVLVWPLRPVQWRMDEWSGRIDRLLKMDEHVSGID